MSEPCCNAILAPIHSLTPGPCTTLDLQSGERETGDSKHPAAPGLCWSSPGGQMAPSLLESLAHTTEGQA